MKKYNSYLKFLFIAFAALVTTGCVHDDKYDAPNLDGYQCSDEVATMTLQQVKNLYTGSTYVFPSNYPGIIEGYVSSTDESGNIYKTIYIQDKPENPTQGFVISVDAVSTYTKYPQGSKVYIKLNDLALGVYGGLVQLGVKDSKTVGTNGVSRIPEKDLAAHMKRSCTVREKIVPKVLTLAQMATSNDLLGALVQINDAEFDKKNLCSVFAPEGFSVDKQINDPTTSNTTRVVRNSGFASFANQLLPAGKGKFIGIFSKFNTTFQLYINKVEDLSDMVNFPRKDGLTSNPCTFDPNSGTAKTVAEVKALINGTALTQITGNFVLKAQVTANDEAANLYKYIYVEDATGGIRININKLDLYLDRRFKVGRELVVRLKDLYVGNNAGEVQLGAPFNGNIGQIEEVDVYKYFVDSNKPRTPVVASEKMINQLTLSDVGRYVTIKNVQVQDADLFKTYAAGVMITDCSNNKILLRTNGLADFAGQEVDAGKGDINAIVTIFNGTYQLLIPFQRDANFDNPRCDGSIPAVYNTLFSDGFDNLNKWTTVSVAGTQVWTTTTFGNPRPSAYMDGNRQVNEDWLISPKINLAAMKDAFLTFETDGRYSGPPLEVYATENYTGNPATTTWVKLNAGFDTDLNNFAGFVSSGRVSLNNYLNKEVTFAYKYTSVAGASTTWELDNVAVKGSK